MNNSNSNSVGIVVIVLIAFFSLLALIGSGSGGSSSNDTYRQNLESGYEKYQKGEKMTREEYNAVKNFNDWKDKQGEKTYSDWNN